MKKGTWNMKSFAVKMYAYSYRCYGDCSGNFACS